MMSSYRLFLAVGISIVWVVMRLTAFFVPHSVGEVPPSVDVLMMTAAGMLFGKDLLERNK